MLLTVLGMALSSVVNVQSHVRLSLTQVVDDLVLDAPAAQIERLNFRTFLFQFENYKKGFHNRMNHLIHESYPQYWETNQSFQYDVQRRDAARYWNEK